VLSSWARLFTLAVSFFNQVYKWVLANSVLEVTLQWSCVGASVLLVTSCYRIWKNLEPLGYNTDFTNQEYNTRVWVFRPTLAKYKPVPLNPDAKYVWPLYILPFQVSLILCRAAECNNSPCLCSFSFQEEEMQDPELDYKLRRSCKKMIKVCLSECLSVCLSVCPTVC